MSYSVGSASLTITPKFDNLGKSVTNALNGIDGTASGVKIGTSVSNGVVQGTSGLAKSGALIGIFSAATTKAMDLIGSSVGSAVSRLDTLNNYPRVMQALGYSAEESQASIAKMADHLTGLPTALNEMTSTVQGISAITGNLDQATNAGLALNDMLLASGSSQAAATAAMEQFRQMLAKGKPEMQDWKSLTSAMPGQLSQLAKAMLGPTANANDLYTALGGGKDVEAIISMDQLMAKMVELDTVGGEGITDFATQAKNATGGIETSMANMQTAVTRGLASMFDSIGTDNIKQVTGDIGKYFENGLKIAGSAISNAMPTIKSAYEEIKGLSSSLGDAAQKGLAIVGDGFTAALPFIQSFYGAIKQIAPSSIPAIASIAGLSAAGKGLSSLSTFVETGGTLGGIAKGLSSSFKSLSGAMDTTKGAGKALAGMSSVLGESMGGPIVAGVGLAVAAFVSLGVAAYDGFQKVEKINAATSGVRDAMDKATSPIQSVSGAFDSISGKAAPAIKSLQEVRQAAEDSAEAGANLAQTINSRADETAKSTGLLETYKNTINELNNKYDDNGNKVKLSASEQARLQYAVEQVNSQCGTQYSVIDKVNGIIADQNGVVQTNTDEINKNIEAKQKQLQADMYSADYADAYKKQLDDVRNLNDAKATLTDQQAKLNEMIQAGMTGDALDPYIQNVDEAQKHVDDLTGQFEADKSAADGFAQSMQDVASGAAEMSVRIQGFMSNNQGISDSLRNMGEDSSTLSQKLTEAGVSAEQMSKVNQDEFQQMVDSCGGNVDALVGMIGMYNAVPILDKEGNVNVEGSTLIDTVTGKLYTWNGTDFVDKEGNVAVKDSQLIDSQNRLYEWDGSSLKDQAGNAWVNDHIPVAQGHLDYWDTSNLDSKEGTATVYDDGLTYANGEKKSWNNGGLADWVGTGTINIVKSVQEIFGGGQASGGIRPNAKGGIRKHAGGGIARKAVPLDIVGEAGAEAIVPLTNKAYVTPFARTVAEQMGGTGGNTTYNVYLNDIDVNDDEGIQSAVVSLLTEVGRKKRM